MHKSLIASVVGAALLGAPTLLLAGSVRTHAVGNLAMATRRGAAKSVARPADEITAADARVWLARYREAWTSRDVETLVELGAIRSEQRDALRQALAGYKRLDVSVSNDVVSLEPGYALLSFDRADIDETGHTLRHPRYEVVLERRAGDLVSTRRNPSPQR
jgi:hypothetical protein